MYQNIYYIRKENKVILFDDEKGMVDFPYQPYAYRKDEHGNFKSIYGDSLSKIYDFDDRYDEHIFESDVNPMTRTLIDLYEDDDSVSKGHVVFNFDIEVGSEGGYAAADDTWQPIISVAFKDSVSKVRHVLLLDEDNEVDDTEIDDDRGHVVVTTFADEKTLLRYFLQKYTEIRPTILIGWNIDNFDIPYTYNRIKKVLGYKYAKQLSPVGISFVGAKRLDNTFETTIAGVSSLDYLRLYKQFTYTELPNYRLGTVGLKEVGMDKLEYDGNLNTLFKTDIKKFIQYNLTDIDIVDALDEKLKLVELVQGICHICHVPYEFIHFSSKFLEGALLTYLRRQKLVAPNRPKKSNDQDSTNGDDSAVGFEGAFVKPPQKGKHEWVFDLDLTSLYPSIIMSLNISPETLIGQVFSHIEPPRPKNGGKQNEMIPAHPSWSPEMFAAGKIDKVYLDADACWRGNDVGDSVVSIDDFRKKIESKKYTVASNGAIYTTDKVGLLGDILDTWFKQRVEYRRLEADYGAMAKDDLKKGLSYYIETYGFNPKDEDQKKDFMDKYKFYNKRQKVQKVLLNSLYGTLGLPVFRFYNLTNAEAVTLTGQSIIKISAKMVNQYYNEILESYEIEYEDGEREIVYHDQKYTKYGDKVEDLIQKVK